MIYRTVPVPKGQCLDDDDWPAAARCGAPKKRGRIKEIKKKGRPKPEE